MNNDAQEIDTPGHTSIISAAHPEHIACPVATPWSDFAAGTWTLVELSVDSLILRTEPPSGQLRLASASTTNFTAGLFSAVAKMFPSTILSTGGDEVNANCYEQDVETQADLKAAGRTIEQALDVFTQKTHGAIIAEGKTPAVWEEMVLDHNITLSNNTIVLCVGPSVNLRGYTTLTHWRFAECGSRRRTLLQLPRRTSVLSTVLPTTSIWYVRDTDYRLCGFESDEVRQDCGAGEWIGKTAGYVHRLRQHSVDTAIG